MSHSVGQVSVEWLDAARVEQTAKIFNRLKFRRWNHRNIQLEALAEASRVASS